MEKINITHKLDDEVFLNISSRDNNDGITISTYYFVMENGKEVKKVLEMRNLPMNSLVGRRDEYDPYHLRR